MPVQGSLASRDLSVDEVFAAIFLYARKLSEMIEADKPNFAKQYFVDRAIDKATLSQTRIDRNCDLGLASPFVSASATRPQSQGA